MTNAPLTVAALRDIVEPPPIGTWPLAAGLWVLIGISTVAAGLLIRQIIRRRQLDAYRRAGLALLQEVAAELTVIQGTRPADSVNADLTAEVLTMARRWIKDHRIPRANAGHGETPAC